MSTQFRIATAISLLLALFILVVFLGKLPSSAEGRPNEIRWRKHDVNDQSPFEAAGAADFNGDGRVDIFCGDSWYESPRWVRHKVREVPVSPNPHYYEDFADLPMDVNGDGRVDIVTCAYFSGRVGWVENSGDPTKEWTEYEIDKPGPIEAAQWVDINGDGKLDLLPNTVNTVTWYELMQQKPKVNWVKHDLGKEGAGHGVGGGDVNGDGRVDIITLKGWYEQPPDAAANKWTFHPEFQLGAAGILIWGRDFNSDKLTDILYGMGHDYGLFYLEQKRSADGKREWTRKEIDTSFSQVHTLLLSDVDGDGVADLVTGKRVYAHETEPGATDAPCVYWFNFDRSAGKWQKHVVYEGAPATNAPKEAKDRWALKDFARGSAGTGLQVEARDMDGDGDVDLVCPGKTGLYLFENLRR
jgi:hypothetical protein